MISLVRSHANGKGTIGFLRDDRRLNVAVTRAKRHCCVICDTDTVLKSSFIRSLIDWIGDHGEHRSAVEQYQDSIIEGELAAVEKEFESLLSKEPKVQKKKRSRNDDPIKHERHVEKQRLTLKSKIEEFVGEAKPGETMTMSRDLSKLDRKIVHEIAEEMGLIHTSKGDDESTRQLYLTIPMKPSSNAGGEMIINDGVDDAVENELIDAGKGEPIEPIVKGQSSSSIKPQSKASFAMLSDDNDGDNDCNGEEKVETQACDAIKNPPTLAELARERRERQQKPQKVVAVNPKPKINIKSGKRLGGDKKKPPQKPKEDTSSLDDLDDMAFLDAQIEQVQTSHGRKVEGKGKNYRTVVNGILLHKSSEPEPPKNKKASAALQNKLRDAQKQRATKSKKR